MKDRARHRALNLARTTDMSDREIARVLRVSPDSIGRWRAEAGLASPRGRGRRPVVRPQPVSLFAAAVPLPGTPPAASWLEAARERVAHAEDLARAESEALAERPRRRGADGGVPEEWRVGPAWRRR